VTVAEHPGTSHVPRRPRWDCVICRDPWPCAPAKVDLAEEYVQDRLALVLYLALQLTDAIDDMAATEAPEVRGLYGRFVGWAALSGPPHRA
jgi:hypothetical protein